MSSSLLGHPDVVSSINSFAAISWCDDIVSVACCPCTNLLHEYSSSFSSKVPVIRYKPTTTWSEPKMVACIESHLGSFCCRQRILKQNLRKLKYQNVYLRNTLKFCYMATWYSFLRSELRTFSMI